jgi:magnesium transporter
MSMFLRQIGNARKNVLSLRKLLGGKADVLRGFRKRCNENYSVTPRGIIALYLGDVQDHVHTMMSNLSHFEQMLARSHSNYLAQLSIDSLGQANQTNKELNTVTLIASVFVPLNLVSGLFGMNVKVPFEDVENLLPFFMIILALVSFTVASVLVLKRLRYF